MSAAERARVALEDFTEQRPAMACRHVVLQGAGALLCAQHPGAGLLCALCQARHVRRHDEQEERTCDECRREVERLRPLVATVELSGGPIRDTKGHHRPFSGVLAVVGVGTCHGCFEGTGRTPVDLATAVLGSGWRP